MEMAQLQQSAVHNHTAAMLEMGTSLLSQTAEQTRKLTDVETQVMAPPRSPGQTCQTQIYSTEHPSAAQLKSSSKDPEEWTSLRR